MELIEEITNATDKKNMQLVYLSILKKHSNTQNTY